MPTRALFLRPLLIPFVFVATLLAACGGSIAPQASTDAGSIDPRALCTRIYNLDSATSCGGAPDPKIDDINFRSGVQECVNFLALPGVGASIAQLDACITSLSPCPGGSAINDCFVRRGTLANGSACITTQQCQSGRCEGGGACGQCMPQAKVGDSCSENECAPDLVCDRSKNPATCAVPVIGGVGAPCGGSGINFCGAGLLCSSTTSMCAKPGALGDPCDAGCAGKLACIGGVCAIPKAEGAACTGGDCAYQLACDKTTSTCVRILADPTEACGGTVICAVGQCYVANGAGDHLCPKLVDEDMPCDDANPSVTCAMYSECQNGRCTPGYANTCP